jgi:hypothetical protein
MDVIAPVIVGIIMIGAWWVFGTLRAQSAQKQLDYEANLPSVRNQSELSSQVLFAYLVKDGTQHQPAFCEVLARRFKDRKIPNVRVTVGKSVDSSETKDAVFIDLTYQLSLVTFAVVLSGYGQDMRLYCWKSEKGRHKLFELGYAQEQGYKILVPFLALGWIMPFLLVVAIFLGGYVFTANGLPRVSDPLLRNTKWMFGWQGVTALSQDDIAVMKLQIDAAVREAGDEVGLGSDDFVPLTVGVSYTST